jgi:hypothetical protein
MRTLSRLMMVTAIMGAGLTLLAGVAAANRSLSLGPAGTARWSSEGSFTLEEPSGSYGIACSWTMNLTIERVIAKRVGTHFGSVTEGRTTACRDTFFGTAASAIYLVEPGRPWDIVYNSFLGTLPRISGILLRMDFRSLTTNAIGRCLWETGAAREMALLWEADSATGAVSRGFFLDEDIRLLIRLTGTCPATAGSSARFRITPTQTVRLL